MGLSLPLVYIIAPLFLSAQVVPDANIAATTDMSETRRLRECLELVETDPEAAHELAATWTYMEGNRRIARECRAASMIALGHYEDGALEFEALANAPDGGSLDDRVGYLARAGGAWLEVGYPEEAIVAFTNALRLNQYADDILAYRGLAHLQLEEYEQAETDLDEAIRRQPGDFYAWLYRAQVRFWQLRMDEAMQDIAQARTLDPANTQALLWRGHIREAQRLLAEGRSLDEMPF